MCMRAVCLSTCRLSLVQRSGAYTENQHETAKVHEYEKRKKKNGVVEKDKHLSVREISRFSTLPSLSQSHTNTHTQTR